MFSIIKKFQGEGTLKLWHSYRAGHFQDLSGNGYNGTPTTVKFTGRGIQAQAATSKVQVAHNAALIPTTGTIVCFGNFPNQYFSKFVEKGDGTTAEYSFYPSSAANMGFRYATTVLTYAINITQKKYLAVNYTTGSTPTMWADGQLQGNFSGACTITASTNDLYILNDGGSARGSLRNTISDVMIISRPLTATEHSQLFGELSALNWPKSSMSRFNLSTDNLLIDGDMETVGVAAWTAGNNATLTKSTVAPYKGTQCLRIAYNGTNNPYAAQTVLTAGMTYRVTGRMKGDGTKYPYIYESRTILTGAATASWQQIDFTFTAQSTDIRLLAAATSAGYAEFDDMRIVPVNNKSWKTDFGANESVAAEGSVSSSYLSNTPFQFGDATARYKIGTATINGKLCKTILCSTAGSLFIPIDLFNQNTTEACHGTWEFWVNKGADANSLSVCFAADTYTPATYNGYRFSISNAETGILSRTTNGSTVTTMVSTAAGALAINTWHKIKITNTSAGVWCLYINDVYIGTASNTIYTTANYFVLDLDAGDQVASSSVGGNYSINKYLSVI